MKIESDLSLAKLTTMRVGGPAQFLTEVDTSDQAIEALAWAKQKGLSFFILGGGSNTIFTDVGFQGLIILNRIKLSPSLTGIANPSSPFRGGSSIDSSCLNLSSGSGFLIEKSGDSYILSSGAGESWDDLVKFSVENQLTGIEALSLIPGTVGAAPVQNIGAYGQQVGDVICELEAIDTNTLEMVKFKPEDCNFSYRSSRFNSSDKGKYLITSVKFKLNKQNYGGKLYKDVEDYLKANQVSAGSDIAPEQIRRAVIDIRSRKLPDPKKVANTGSFFKNPVISEIEFTKLKGKAPDILNKPQGWNQPPFWRVDNNYKISAGWLVQESGFANYYDRNLNFGTWPRQNLVIFSKINQPEYNNLKRFKQLIQESVRAKFGITLEQEPEEVLL